MTIWSERPHKSEVSGDYLGEEPMSYFFSHVCSVGAYPNIAFEPRNIMLMTLDEHQEWEFGSPSGKKWDKVFERKEEMKQLSNQLLKESFYAKKRS